MPEIFPNPPPNDQKMAQLEADIQALTGTLVEAFSPKVNWSKFELYTQKEGEHPKVFTACVILTF